MRAVRAKRCGPPEVLELVNDVPIPEPAESQVLVQLKAIGVNQLDLCYRAGLSSPPSLPYTPGTDAAGEIVKTGAAVKKFKNGDRVYVCLVFSVKASCYSDFVVASVDDVHSLPVQLDFRQGAALGIPYFTAYRALFQLSKAETGHTVLVHGASGSVGLSALQLCRGHRITVWGTAGSNDGLELIKKEGAQQVFNHREEGYSGKIMAATNGKGVDIILEMAAHLNIQTDIDMLAMNGTIVVIGCRGELTYSQESLVCKNGQILRVSLMSSTQGEREEQFAGVTSGIEGGWIRPVNDKEYPLEDAAAAHRYLENTKATLGKIILIP